MASSISFWNFALEDLEFYHEQFSSNRLNPFTLLVPKPQTVQVANLMAGLTHVHASCT